MNKPRVSAEFRQTVRERAQGLCEYCRCPSDFVPDPFEVEHIVPTAKGGATMLSNLAYACRGCNLKKSVKMFAEDALTGRRLPLFHPRRQIWENHFAWGRDYTIVIGLTPTGRATVDALALNRPELINLRRALYFCGEHPPEFAA